MLGSGWERVGDRMLAMVLNGPNGDRILAKDLFSSKTSTTQQVNLRINLCQSDDKNSL